MKHKENYKVKFETKGIEIKRKIERKREKPM